MKKAISRETLNEIAKAKAHLDRFIVALVDAMPDAEERGAHELALLNKLVEGAGGSALLAAHRALGDSSITKVEAIAAACDEEGGW